MPILFSGTDSVEYSIRQSARAKRVNFVVHWDGRAELVVPKRARLSMRSLERFIAQQADWIVSQVTKSKKHANKTPLQHRGIPRERIEQETKEVVWKHIERLCAIHPFEIKRVRFRKYSSRWGSCDSDRVLSFHYKLSLLPEDLVSYIVVHELCHTVHMNHSSVFWNLVASYCEDHKRCRKALKQYLL